MKNTKSTNLKSTLLVFSFTVIVFTTPGCNKSSKVIPLINPGAEKLVTQAEQIILEGLNNPDPQIRANAIEVVAATKYIKLMPRVQKLLADEFVPVRFAAALAVGDTQYNLAKEPIKKLLKAPDENTKIAAAYAMYKFGHTENIEIIRSAITSKDQTLRANAAALLGKTDDKNQLKLLYWALQDNESDDIVRFQAVESIAMLGDEKIFRKLWSILISVYADDRVIAIRGMGLLGTKQAKDVLTTKLDDDVLEVRLAAAEQLGVLDDPIGEPEVLAVFTKNLTSNMDQTDRQRVHMRTALAIGEIGTKALTNHLPQLLNDDSKLVRLAAAKAVFRVRKAR
jgi:HEAT repeat protein